MFKTSTTTLFVFLFLIRFNVLSQTTNEVTYDKGGTTITFYYNCDNGPCQTGQFVTGDYWVAPNTPNGKVTITNITPVGNVNGAMLNADLLRDNEGNLLDYDDQKQGILGTYGHYNADLDLMNQLPYDASGGDAIIKIAGFTGEGCGTSAIETGCVDSAAILTIMSEIPQDRGANTFRPPFVGTNRPLYTTDRVMMDRLPRLPQATGLLGEPTTLDNGNQSYKKWLVPQIDIYSKGISGQGEFMRATIPHSVQATYAAGQAAALFDDIFRVFGEEDNDLKKETVYAIIQKGIDNYAIYKEGLGFSTGAGQFMGKKPPITFFAALYNDATILEDVRSIATDPVALSKSLFQADSQIRAGINGAIWGEDSLPEMHNYFSDLYPSLDNGANLGDPFDYIDGPAGSGAGKNYLSQSAPGHIAYSLLQHLMPWFKYAAGDDEILQFSDRFYDGYGIDNFDGGLWTLPDPLAPKDPIDVDNGCQPFKLYSTGNTNCSSYMITWGPLSEDHPDYDENNPKNNYIAHDQDPNTYGRMSQFHGLKINLERENDFVTNYWDVLRRCSDPTDPSYPCVGMGAKIDEALSTSEELLSENITITNSEEHLIFKIATSYTTIKIKIYAINGSEIINDEGSGNLIAVDNSKLSTGIYIYNIILDGIRYNGKIGISQ